MTNILSRRTGAWTLTALALALLSLTLAAHAQDEAPAHPDTCAAARNTPSETRTFYLANATKQPDGNEVMVAMRNMLCPSVKIYYVNAMNAIVIEAAPQQLDLAAKIIHDLDRPRKAYRLTFTLTELDGEKTISTQHVSTVAVVGEHTNLKQGEKIPIATGVYTNGAATTTSSSESQTQFTYLDVGTNFDITITEQANGVSLASKIEESSVGTPQTILGVTEPVIRQTVLTGTSLLTLDKPVMLGSIDVPNSTHHFDIAVVLQPIK